MSHVLSTGSSDEVSPRKYKREDSLALVKPAFN